MLRYRSILSHYSYNTTQNRPFLKQTDEITENRLHKDLGCNSTTCHTVSESSVQAKDNDFKHLESPPFFSTKICCLDCLFCCLWTDLYYKQIQDTQANRPCFRNDFMSTLCLQFMGQWFRGNAATVSQGFCKYTVRKTKRMRRNSYSSTHCYRNFPMTWHFSALKNPIANCWPVSEVTSRCYLNLDLFGAKIQIKHSHSLEQVQLLTVNRNLRHDYHNLKSNLRQSYSQ